MRFTALLSLAIAFAAPAHALDIVALGAGATANQIVRFDSAAPNVIDGPTPVTNLGGYTLVALDRRPATGDVVAVGVSADSVQLFVIDLATAAATPIGTAATVSTTGATAFGADFDPVVDRMRVVNNLASDGAGGNANNFRLDPNTGALVTVDPDLDFGGLPGGNANAPEIAVAYTNSFPDAPSTTLIGIGAGGDRLIQHGGAGPGFATLQDIGALGIDASTNGGFDIGGSPEAGFAILENGGVSSVFSVNLVTGAATGIGTVGTGSTDVAGMTIVGATTLVTTSRLVCGATPLGTAERASADLFTPDAPGDAGACPALCRKWTSACRGLVSAVRSCWKNAGGRVAKLRAADCGTLAGDERDACRDELEGHRAELKAFLAEDGAAGAAECQGDGLAQCLLGCG
jgi:hypothetical protein